MELQITRKAIAPFMLVDNGRYTALERSVYLPCWNRQRRGKHNVHFIHIGFLATNLSSISNIHLTHIISYPYWYHPSHIITTILAHSLAHRSPIISSITACPHQAVYRHLTWRCQTAVYERCARVGHLIRIAAIPTMVQATVTVTTPVGTKMRPI
jgi:hypothetical protein